MSPTTTIILYVMSIALMVVGATTPPYLGGDNWIQTPVSLRLIIVGSQMCFWIAGIVFGVGIRG